MGDNNMLATTKVLNPYSYRNQKYKEVKNENSRLRKRVIKAEQQLQVKDKEIKKLKTELAVYDSFSLSELSERFTYIGRSKIQFSSLFEEIK